MSTKVEIVEEIRQASKDLLCISESEFPYEVFCWDDFNQLELTPKNLLQYLGCSSDTPVVVENIDFFFRHATALEDWQTESEKEIASRHKELIEILKNNLKNIQVFRVGEIEVDVYIVGQTAVNKFVGLHTKVVET